MPTDVVTQIENYVRPAAAKDKAPATSAKSRWHVSTPRIPNQKMDPLVGGVPIRNPNISNSNAGVLGAIVFDAKDGRPMGLSVQHAIGNQKPGDRAKLADPIHQPMKQEAKFKIGSLYKFDEEYDVALILLDEKRSYTHKVRGKDEDYELGEPIRPYFGMRVECLGRHNYATGEVDRIYWRQRSSDSKTMCLINILFDEGCQTSGGDSGSLWVDIATKRPVGLHRSFYSFYFSTRKSRFGTAAEASCIYQLASDWHPFQFAPPKPREFESELTKFDTQFAERGTGLVAFCFQPAEKLVIKKFDRNLAKTSESVQDLFPMSPPAVASLDNIPPKTGTSTFAFWRSANQNKIQTGQLRGTSLNKLAFLDLATTCQPAVVTAGNQLIMAFVDASTGKLKITTSTDGINWSPPKDTARKSSSAPAMVVFNSQILLCWADPGNRQLRIGTLEKQRNQTYNLRSDTTLSEFCTNHSPALCADANAIYLGYTNLKDELRVMESKGEIWRWSLKSSSDQQTKASPALICFRDELLSTRRIA